MTYFPIKDLKRAEYNPRIMPEKEMDALMKSIETHGFVEPIVVNINKERYGIIVGGHQRLTAIEKLIAKNIIPKGIDTVQLHSAGISHHIPAFKVDLDLESEKQLNIGLNRIHGRFEEDKLYEIIASMKDSPTLMTTGFGEDEISRLLDRNMEEDEIEEEESGEIVSVSKPGEIYELGPHRLICGDSTNPATYTKLFTENPPAMIWTDPPYNVDYEGKTDEKMTIKNDHMDALQFSEFIDKAFYCMLSIVRAGTPFYICSGWSSYPQFLQSMLKNGFHHSGVIIWVKNNATFGFNDYKYKHEWIAKAKKADPKTAESIIYGWKNGKHVFFGDNEFDVWEMPRRTANRDHPTEKPDWLIMRAIRNSTKRDDIILDPFSGSGSLMAACQKTGRRAYMIELDPKFCDVIRKRWARIEKSQKNERAS